MRPTIAAILACLALAACGTTHKTVVVNPPPADSTVVNAPPGSTTVIDSNGHTHVIEHDNDRDPYNR